MEWREALFIVTLVGQNTGEERISDEAMTDHFIAESRSL